VLGGDAEAAPAGLVEGLPRLLETRRSFDATVLERAADPVADRVERPDDVARPLVDAVQDGVDVLPRPLGVGLAAQEIAQAELLEEEEADVAEVAAVPVDVLAHVGLLNESSFRA
jgi:hypothetical protein